MADVYLSTLRVEQERLLARVNKQWEIVEPCEIVAVNEYGFNNPLLIVTTTKGKFRVGLLSKHYDDVVRFLMQHVDSDFHRSLTHRMNVLIWKRRFSVASLLQRLVTAPFNLCSRTK